MQGGSAPDVVATSAVLSDAGAFVMSALSDGRVSMWMSRKNTTKLSVCQSQRGEVTCVGIDEWSVNAALRGEQEKIMCCGGSRSGYCELFELSINEGDLKPIGGWRAHSTSTAWGLPFAGTSCVATDAGCVVTGGSDSMAGLWTRSHDGNLPPILQRRVDGAHGGAVTAACHKKVGGQHDFTLTGGEDSVVKAWSTCGDCQLPSHEKDAANSSRSSSLGLVRNVFLDTINHRCCASCEDGFVRVWDLAGGCATLRLGHQCADASTSTSTERPRVQVAAFDGGTGNVSKLVSGCDDGSLCIWDVRQSACTVPVLQFKAHLKAVSSVAPFGDRVLVASLDGNASLWDLRKHQPLMVQTVQLCDPTAEGGNNLDERGFTKGAVPTGEIEPCVSQPVDPSLLQQSGRPQRTDNAEHNTDDAGDSWLSFPGQVISGGLLLPKVLVQMASESLLEPSHPEQEATAQQRGSPSLYDLLNQAESQCEGGGGGCGLKPSRICVPWNQIAAAQETAAASERRHRDLSALEIKQDNNPFQPHGVIPGDTASLEIMYREGDGDEEGAAHCGMKPSRVCFPLSGTTLGQKANQEPNNVGSSSTKDDCTKTEEQTEVGNVPRFSSRVRFHKNDDEETWDEHSVASTRRTWDDAGSVSSFPTNTT